MKINIVYRDGETSGFTPSSSIRYSPETRHLLVRAPGAFSLINVNVVAGFRIEKGETVKEYVEKGIYVWEEV